MVLPPETLARSTATALRLTVLMGVLSRNKGQHTITYNIPEEVRGDRFIGLQFHRVDHALIVNGLLDGDTRTKLGEGTVNCLLEAAPQLEQCPLMNLPQIQKSVKLKCNFKSPGLMSLALVIPSRPWTKDILNRNGTLQG